jgi:hypothetical protein
MAVRFCGAPACCPSAAKTISQTVSGAYALATVTVPDTAAVTLVGSVTLVLACPSSVSISAPLNVTLSGTDPSALIALPIVVENTSVPVTSLSSAVPLTVEPSDTVQTVTPTEVLQLGTGTYRVYVTAQSLVAATSVNVAVSGEINVLAVVKKL